MTTILLLTLCAELALYSRFVALRPIQREARRVSPISRYR